MARARTPSPESLLRRLERLKAVYGPQSADAKLPLLASLADLANGRLARPSQILRLHEALCFLRAYPDDARVLALVEAMLARFAARTDLVRHRETLADSGIAGTEIRFRFFAPAARWLVERWPERLTIDWKATGHQERIVNWLPRLTLPAEGPGLDECDMALRDWIDTLKGPRETDATFLVRRLAHLGADPFVRERLFDDLDPAFRLRWGAGGPSRTDAKLEGAQVTYQRTPLVRGRADLQAALRMRPQRVQRASPHLADRLIDLAREAMVTRERDLDVFSFADRRDVRLVSFDDGLAFACFGFVPERRLLLEAVQGFLTLKNGVPIGYVLSGALFESAEIAYNVFETFRGAEAASVYARVIAMTHHLLGARDFTIDPYQLGRGNPEAIASGAWWFYRKMGYTPIARRTVPLMRAEERRIAARPGRLSSRITLNRLAEEPLYWFADRPRADVMGRLSFADLGIRVSRMLGAKFGADRETALAWCRKEAARRLGLRSLSGFTRGERVAWDLWAPLVVLLPGLSRWRPADRRALIRVVRAKGGASEYRYVRLFDRHIPLRRAIVRLGDASQGMQR